MALKVTKVRMGFWRGKGDTEYFRRLGGRLDQFGPDLSAEIIKHLDYLAKKAGVSRDWVSSGLPFAVSRRVHADAVKNIDAVMRKSEAGDGDARGDDQRPWSAHPTKTDAVTQKLIERAERELEGWCSREKSTVIADIVISERAQICVEIGVYGGRSLIPVAAALKQNGKGEIYGIETWDPTIATEYVTNESNDTWWRGIDFNAIKRNFYRFIAEQDLASQVRIIEAPSADAASLFKTLDYLHIDGAHSTYNAAEDVVLYAKKVRRRGIIILDDTNWPTTKPAVDILDSICERIREFKDEHGNVACILFRKR
ncbi:class I SAM-dependent methyltransferase [Mesorhizobium loti]|uniref:class I SAM-dependent methyltransferase n=1 Tax=Rhizobium loti TaxID=381 RepID=UPI001427EDE0|nr:class I SAM-dependent methyltransferase [Mesorhizobium loti]